MLAKELFKRQNKFTLQTNQKKEEKNQVVFIQTSLVLGVLLSVCIYSFYFFGISKIVQNFWPFIIKKYKDNQIYFYSMSLINIIVFWVISYLFVFLQRIQKFNWLERLKITRKKWPWQQNIQKWCELLGKTALMMLINGVFISSVIMLVTLLKPLPYDFSCENWPSSGRIAIQILFFMLVQDCLFYFTHRLLHQPKFYWIHKRHHEYNQTLSIAVQYSHPIDYIISSLFPFSAGFLFLSFVTNVHIFTIILWVFYRSYQTFIGHCGYDFFFDPGNLVPFCIGADHHDFHHANSTGNYGSLFMFWDALFGTQKDYVQWLRKDVKQGKKIDMQKQ